ncbi:MAG: 4-hydroxy-tetrahydrodipicolinate synthase [Chlamydiia bacterium]|nr:4-hydroxy-tetrahydrodipicolinate synthase [Chlamydiia bacterium]MCH9618447.1 4-hydroxy-tetrahydrodipicolinate synthase [Chlamydiia bacterium]MCH9623910.1 4-hydroxy-tetrahydrodipicolinate synthase [Chlamydiia bacterium]
MEGVYTAIVTPFKQDGSIDADAFIRLLKLQHEAGINGIVIGGTTGEGWSLSEAEVTLLHELARLHFSGKIIIGTSDISTKGAVAKTQHAKNIGADAALVVVPYYNFPNEEGIIAHYKAVAETGIPIMVYHHPKRTGIKLSLECLERLCLIEGVVAVKETSGDEGYIRALSKKVVIFSGDDLDMKRAKNLGAKGVISVVSNILPAETKEFFATDERFFPQDFSEFVEELFKEGNPAGIKEALKLKKRCDNFLRLPLLPLTQAARKQLREKMGFLDYKETANK